MFTNPTGGLISSFSSYGLSPDLALKPDIGAPGGLIRSTYPLEGGAYATISGTSMSSPHVAGGVALLLEAQPNVGAHDVRGILQNSAKPKNWWGNPGLGFLDNVHRQGAGMLDIPNAILATTRVTPAKIALGESEAGPRTETLWIENHGDAPVTYDLSFVNALSTGGSTFSPGFFLGNASVAFGQPSVTVPAGGSASVSATINPATAPALGQYGGYIMLTPQGGGLTHRVPYAGFVGDYQAIVAMAPGAFGLPLLGQATDCFRVVDGECIDGFYTCSPTAAPST
jgi:minor extracellular serine protease Vpr